MSCILPPMTLLNIMTPFEVNDFKCNAWHIYMVKSGIEVIYMSYKPESQNIFSDTTPQKEPDFI